MLYKTKPILYIDVYFVMQNLQDSVTCTLLLFHLQNGDL